MRQFFSTEEADQLSNLYHQLYFNQGIRPSEIFVTHYKFGCVLMAGDLIGSNMPGRNSKSSAVVMAYWQNREDLTAIDHSTMQVGVVQYFSRHKFRYCIINFWQPSRRGPHVSMREVEKVTCTF